MTDKSSNPLEPVCVELTETNVYTRWGCNVCGGRTEKVGVLAEVREGELSGLRVCENCLRRASAGESLDPMLQARSDALQREAAELCAIKGRLQLPSYQDWGRAMLEHDYQACLDRCSDLIPVSENEPPDSVVNRADVRTWLLGAMPGTRRDKFADGAAFQLYAIARAVEDGHLTLEDIKVAVVEAAFPLHANQQPAGSDADDSPF